MLLHKVRNTVLNFFLILVASAPPGDRIYGAERVGSSAFVQLTSVRTTKKFCCGQDASC